MYYKSTSINFICSFYFHFFEPWKFSTSRDRFFNDIERLIVSLNQLYPDKVTVGTSLYYLFFIIVSNRYCVKAVPMPLV